MSAERQSHAAPARSTRLISPARVTEVTAESSIGELPELPMHLLGAPGEIAIQLRRTVRRLAMGAGLARDADLVEKVRALPSLPGLVTSPVGGTFIVGGEAWLGLCAIGAPPVDHGMPLDWMSDSLNAWFAAALGLHGVEMTTGRIDGAWCPGFSDIAAGGRKLIGLGFRVTREWVVMRGVMPVGAISDADNALLTAAHALIGVDVRADASTSLGQASGHSHLDVTTVIDRWRGLETAGRPRN